MAHGLPGAGDPSRPYGPAAPSRDRAVARGRHAGTGTGTGPEHRVGLRHRAGGGRASYAPGAVMAPVRRTDRASGHAPCAERLKDPAGDPGPPT